MQAVAMPALAEARATLAARNPAAALKVNAAMAAAAPDAARAASALTARGVFSPSQNAVRARATARVKLHNKLSSASLMLADSPAAALARAMPREANLCTLEAFADGLARVAERGARRTTANATERPGVAAARPGARARLPTNRALCGDVKLAFARHEVAAASQPQPLAEPTPQTAALAASLRRGGGGASEHYASAPTQRSKQWSEQLAQRKVARVEAYRNAVAQALPEPGDTATAPCSAGSSEPAAACDLKAMLAALHLKALEQLQQEQAKRRMQAGGHQDVIAIEQTHALQTMQVRHHRMRSRQLTPPSHSSSFLTRRAT